MNYTGKVPGEVSFQWLMKHKVPRSQWPEKALRAYERFNGNPKSRNDLRMWTTDRTK